jgi:hypothetical protein
VLLVVGITQLTTMVWRIPLPARRSVDNMQVTP